MNNFYSQPENYFTRWLEKPLARAAHDHAVIVLTGARQVGKSTLLRRAQPFASWRYHTLDDYDTLRLARNDPRALWAGANEIVLDEVQKAPELLMAIKQTVDEQPGRYHFMLSGSANLALLRSVSESLAGRAVYFTLHPMTWGEEQRAPQSDILMRLLAGDWPAEGNLSADPPTPLLLQRGTMPPLLALTSSEAWMRWWEGYVATYLERDVRQLSQVADLLDLRRLMELAALRCAQVVNQSELARDAGLSQATTHRYLNILEATYLYQRLPAYIASRSARLVKSPKGFWADPALAAYLAGYFDATSLRQARELGAFYETLLYQHLRAQAELLTPRARLYYWRERAGAEVDFVIEHGRHVLAIEAKMTPRPGFDDAAGLRAFLAAHPQASGGIIAHTGPAVRYLGERIIALPWTILAGS